MRSSLITKQTTIDTIADRWRRQYTNYSSSHPLSCGETVGSIHEKLKALNSSATESDIAAIVGNSSWTRLKCFRCEQEVNELASISDDENSLQICRECFNEIGKLFPETEGNK